MSSSHLTKLKSLVRSRDPSVAELKIALSQIRAGMSERMKQAPSDASTEFFKTLVEVLPLVRGTIHAEQRMDMLFDSILYMLINDCFSTALRGLEELTHLSSRAQIPRWCRKAETIAGMIHGDLGNTSEAILRYANALKLAQEGGESIGEAAVILNLGVALMYSGLYHEAISCFEKILRLATSAGFEELCARTFGEGCFFELSAYTNLAQCYFFLEDFPRGFELISLSVRKSTEPTQPFNCYRRTIREFTYVLLAIECKRFDSAVEHATQCRHYAERGGARAILIAEIATGLCEVLRGDAEKGLRMLEGTLAKSGSAGNGLRVQALLALVRSLEDVGKPERALKYVRDALHDIKTAREKCAVVVANVRNGTSRIVSENEDLRRLRFAEATLRARVAEDEAANIKYETFERLAITADLRNDSSGAHGYRVGELSALLATEIGMAPGAARELGIAARLHDIGKIGMPDSILLKSASFAEPEREFMMAHTVAGREILTNSGMRHFQMAEEIALLHHEWWNGQGYPTQLSGPRIPRHARIVAIADVFDALIHGRPYAEPWQIERAIGEIEARAGTQFDPDLASVFVRMIGRLEADGRLHDLLNTKSAFLQARLNIRALLEKGNPRASKITDTEPEAVAQ